MTALVPVATRGSGSPIECGPKATCQHCKSYPNAYNMNTDLEGILSSCLRLYLSFSPGMVNFYRYVFSPNMATILFNYKYTERDTRKNIKMSPRNLRQLFLVSI
jgi:hypothetical protein